MPDDAAMRQDGRGSAGERGPGAAGRVLLVTSNFPRWQGDATTPFVLHLAQDLQGLGWAVDVLAPHAPGALTHEKLAGLQVDRFRYLWPEALETVCYQGGALVNLRRRRSNLLKLPALVLSEWLAVMRRLMAGRYDLLNSHWILPQGFVGTLAAGPLGIPHVVTVHGGDVFALRGRLLGAFKKFALKGADAVTVNSSATWDAVHGILAAPKRIERIPMGVSQPSRDRPSEAAALRAKYRRAKGPLLVFVGRVVEEKGVADLLHAIALLVPRLPDLTAVIVGDGQDRGELERLAGRLEIGDRVGFTGWVAAEQVADHLKCADVFVGPSRRAADGWQEAQGLTFLEAMMAQTPVIATRTGGIGDTVRHEETGLLVAEAAPQEIAAAVLRLVDDSALAERLRRRGSELVNGSYSRSASAKRFSDLFQSVIPARQG